MLDLGKLLQTSDFSSLLDGDSDLELDFDFESAGTRAFVSSFSADKGFVIFGKITKLARLADPFISFNFGTDAVFV